jgi:hypothetical protein
MTGIILLAGAVLLTALGTGILIGWILGHDRGELSEMRRCQARHSPPVRAVPLAARLLDLPAWAAYREPATEPLTAADPPPRARRFTSPLARHRQTSERKSP